MSKSETDTVRIWIQHGESLPRLAKEYAGEKWRKSSDNLPDRVVVLPLSPLVLGEAYFSPTDTVCLQDLLTELWEYLDDREDVLDGESGPRPNKAMQLKREVEKLLVKEKVEVKR